MNRTSAIRLGAFLVAFLAVGVPYWRLEYAQVQLPTALEQPQLLAVAIAAFVVRRFTETSVWNSTSIAGVAVPAVVLARVIVETSDDPTSHNLWPFEAVIAIGVGLIAAAVGALLASWRRPSP
jgi:hypothetical protein